MPKEARIPKRKKAAPAPYDAKAKAKPTEKKNPLFEKRPKVFGIGGDLHPGREVTRFVKWPKYIRLQRQRRILYSRLKTPPTINQFSRTLDKNTATHLFKLLVKYKPEDKAAKKQRLLALAKAKTEKGAQTTEDKGAQTTKKPNVVKYGINHITRLVEQKKAKLVIIAHDVDPIELVVWLPTLCRKMNVPYCIVKGKARLGAVVGKKNATALALVNVNKEDTNEFNTLQTAIKENYNDRYDEFRRVWGGGKLGAKSEAVVNKKKKIIQKEAQRMQQ
jgi:large subunit ribosomal protein L7Ae